jgi:hypothetical protein
MENWSGKLSFLASVPLAISKANKKTKKSITHLLLLPIQPQFFNTISIPENQSWRKNQLLTSTLKIMRPGRFFMKARMEQKSRCLLYIKKELN